jgi:hypothetical protein
MRRLPVIFGLFGVLAVPAAALAVPAGTTDGSLVVKNGSAPYGTPVVALQITGSAIGNIDHGRLLIDVGPNADPDQTPQVTGNVQRGDAPKQSPTAQVWRSNTPFKFRVVGGKNMLVLVYGSGVDLVAVGKGTVKLAGLPDTPIGDGRYSLNDGDFASLPGIPTDWLSIKSTG